MSERHEVKLAISLLEALDNYYIKYQREATVIKMNALTYVDICREYEKNATFVNPLVIRYKKEGKIQLVNTMDRNKFELL